MSDPRVEGIKATFLRYMKGWLDRDIDTLMSIWDSKETDVTYMPAEVGTPIFGHAALRAYTEQIAKNFPIIAGTLGTVTVRPLGDTIYALSYIDWKFKVGEAELSMPIRITALLRQRGGAWYIGHMHESITWQPPK